MTDNTLNNEYKSRLAKLKQLRDRGINPYPDHFNKTHSVSEVLELPDETADIHLAGRVMRMRRMGKIIFCHVQDSTGRMQIVVKQDEIGDEAFKQFIALFDVADFIGVGGSTFTTQKGEHSLLIKHFQLLSKTVRPLPDKWHGLKDQEAIYRQRYLETTTNREAFERFLFRSRLIRLLREFYWQHGFIEVETPILTNTASGALAKPFTTHHNALDIDVFLRIAPETYLKECIVAGFEKVFEVGRAFRNEGMDPSHLQDFTMAEHYAAYWNFEDNMRFTEEMFVHLLKELFGTLQIPIKNRQGKVSAVDFTPPWPKISFAELIKKDAGIDITALASVDELRQEIAKKKIKIDDIEKLGRGNLIDALFKAVSRDKLVAPTFLIHHPIDLSPLARRNDTDPSIVDRFQLVINTWEIVNAYSELIDPVDQAQRFKEQASAKKKGDEEAHGKDDEFVRALEHGAPPTSGWGMGIDRLVTLLTQQDNLRDVVLFPLLKPEK